jgi:hypothetical protein
MVTQVSGVFWSHNPSLDRDRTPRSADQTADQSDQADHTQSDQSEEERERREERGKQ